MGDSRAVVVDASVALKWIIQEDGTDAALELRKHLLIAPDLILAECSNALWRKAERGELSEDEAVVAAELLAHSSIDLRSTRRLAGIATRMAIALGHPAYDCFYVALAQAEGIPLVTADLRLLGAVSRAKLGKKLVIDLRGAALL